ncbi:MAG: hypothetical protein ACK4Y5_20240 [Acetobacteraceae bacterium]
MTDNGTHDFVDDAALHPRRIVQNVEKLDLPPAANDTTDQGDPRVSERQVSTGRAADQCHSSRGIAPRKAVRHARQQLYDYIAKTDGSAGLAGRQWWMVTVRLGEKQITAIKKSIETNSRPASSFVGRRWGDALDAAGVGYLKGFSPLALEPDRDRAGGWHVHVLVPARDDELKAVLDAARRLAGRDAPPRATNAVVANSNRHWENRRGAAGLVSYKLKRGAAPWRELNSRSIFIPHAIRRGELPPANSVVTDNEPARVHAGLADLGRAGGRPGRALGRGSDHGLGAADRDRGGHRHDARQAPPTGGRTAYSVPDPDPAAGPCTADGRNPPSAPPPAKSQVKPARAQNRKRPQSPPDGPWRVFAAGPTPNYAPNRRPRSVAIWRAFWGTQPIELL